MWEIGLALAASLAVQPQDTAVAQPQAATLEGCEFVNERWVCRYRLPEIQLLTSPPTSPTVLPVIPAPGGPAIAPTSLDPGVLSDDESRLVARCAEAGWLSLCLPSQRVEARRLQAQAQAYEEARQRVGELISDGQCDAARTHALTGGYLGLARESQALCAAPGDTAS